jgi:hypothetical protein
LRTGDKWARDMCQWPQYLYDDVCRDRKWQVYNIGALAPQSSYSHHSSCRSVVSTIPINTCTLLLRTMSNFHLKSGTRKTERV